MTQIEIFPPPAPPKGVPEEVAALFETYALAIIKNGMTRYSADAILHRIRWHHQIERGDRNFKANDHWTSGLARWFIKKHPQHASFFETRTRKSKHVDHQP